MGNWPGWKPFLERLKGILDVSEYVFLSNPSMTEGSWDGSGLTLWAANGFLRDMLDKPSITRPIAQLLQQVTGSPAQVKILEGRAPTGQNQAAPPPVDPLDAFLAQSGSNVVIE